MAKREIRKKGREDVKEKEKRTRKKAYTALKTLRQFIQASTVEAPVRGGVHQKQRHLRGCMGRDRWNWSIRHRGESHIMDGTSLD